MIGLLLVIAGVVGLAINPQFHGQETVSVVLLVIGAAICALQLVVGIIAANTIRKTHKEMRSEFNGRFNARDRRGF